MNEKELREALRKPEVIAGQAFDILRSIACLVADPDKEILAHEMVLRTLEHQEHFTPYFTVLDSLIRAVGLFPYLEQQDLDLRDAIAYEFHRPSDMGIDFVFHREQAEVYRRILDGDSVILSAPTSFGKSKIIDAVIASRKFRNIAVIVPTLALIDETRRRLSQFADRYKIVTHLSQCPSDSNIFVFTAERAVAYDQFPVIDFFVIDEFYKLGAISVDEDRTVALNQALYKLLKYNGQFYLLGPNIHHIPDGLESAYRCFFYPTRYSTVVTEQIMVPGRGNGIHRLVTLCQRLNEPTLIFCKSPARVNEVAHALIEAGVGVDAPELQPAADWAGRNYHPEWVFGKALVRGIGIHHGRLPRSLAQYVVRMFNDLRLRFLVCTSTLIEGVNTKAKNVVIFDNKIAREQIDFFTFNNIRGRSGRMFEHFVGHVYLFDEPPTEELPFVDFPLFTQKPDAPDSLLVQMEEEDLSQPSRDRMREYYEERVLPISVLRDNSSIDPEAQIALARHLLDTPSIWPLLRWTQTPNGPELKAVCNLIWTFFVNSARSGGVFSGAQLATKVWHLLYTPDMAKRVLEEFNQPAKYAAKTPDVAVERVLEFERNWAGFELPRYLMAVSRIQRAVFRSLKLSFGDYSFFASQVECSFRNPVVAALDEYGVPVQLGIKVTQAINETDDLDAALVKLKRLPVETLTIDDFERELLLDARQFLP